MSQPFKSSPLSSARVLPRLRVRSCPRKRAAFTLLELLLVLSLIAIAVAISIPSYSAFGRGRVIADTSAHFVAATHFARTQAISDGTVYRVNIDVAAGRWWITMADNTGINFLVDNSRDGSSYTVPDGIHIETALPIIDGAQVIEFQSTGRTDPGSVTFTGQVPPPIQVVCDTPLDVYHVVTGGTK